MMFGFQERIPVPKYTCPYPSLQNKFNFHWLSRKNNNNNNNGKHLNRTYNNSHTFLGILHIF